VRTSTEEAALHHDKGEGPEGAMPPARAWGVAVLAFVAFVVAFFLVPQALVSGLGGLSRGLRVALAAGWVVLAFVAFGAVAWWRSGGPAR
jgi:hypothetical protein